LTADAGSGPPASRLQEWQGSSALPKTSLVFPLFIVEDDGAQQPIATMPGQYRWGSKRLQVRRPAAAPVGCI
jgi:delta-aminolevulinic acid dehydratase/porphobilinogen synthase